MDKEWYESAAKLQRIQDLLRRYRDDKNQKDCTLISILEKVRYTFDFFKSLKPHKDIQYKDWALFVDCSTSQGELRIGAQCVLATRTTKIE
jgi:hypothetical protein